MSRFEVPDPKIEVNLLLGRTVRPVGWDVVGRKLDPDPGLPSTKTMCQLSSTSTVPPRILAQKLLSAVKSAASNTTT